MKKTALLLPLLAVVLISSGCGQPTKKVFTTPSTTPLSVTGTTTVQHESSAVSSFATFASEDLGLSFAYPTKFSDDPECSPEMYNGKVSFLGGQVMVSRTKSNSTLAAAVKNESDGYSPDEIFVQNRTINGSPAAQIDWHSSGGTNDFGSIVLISHGGYLYKMTIDGKPTWSCLGDISDEARDAFFSTLYNSIKF